MMDYPDKLLKIETHEIMEKYKKAPPAPTLSDENGFAFSLVVVTLWKARGNFTSPTTESLN